MDLAKYLRDTVENPVMGVVSVPAEKLLEVAVRIEHLERELADSIEKTDELDTLLKIAASVLDVVKNQLAAEKALADRSYEALMPFAIYIGAGQVEISVKVKSPTGKMSASKTLRPEDFLGACHASIAYRKARGL